MSNNRLGKNQRAILRTLVEHKSWYDGCGWHWGSTSETTRLLDSLLRYGLVTRIVVEHQRIGMGPHRGTVAYRPYMVAEYQPTADGRLEVGR